MAIKPRRKKKAESWNFSEMHISDYVAFLTGHPCPNGRINTVDKLREARRHYGCNYTSELLIEDRERIFPERNWR